MIFEKIKNLFRSRKKKLILDIKKKHKIDITDYDIVQYKNYTGLNSDNAVLMMILAAPDLDNRSNMVDARDSCCKPSTSSSSCTSNYSSSSEDSGSSWSSRNDDYTLSYSSSCSSSSSSSSSSD